MSRRAVTLTIAVVFLGLTSLILWITHGEFWAIDGCLDSGGAWNYETKECEH